MLRTVVLKSLLHLVIIASLACAAQAEKNSNVLHQAANQNDRKTLKSLLKNGFNINALDASGRTALFIALDAKHFKTADWLITQGTDLSLKDASQQSVLHLAIKQGSKAIAFRLIFSDYNPNEIDINGISVLELAAQKGWADVVEILIDKGAKSSASKPAHQLPAYLAGKKGYIKVVKRLAKYQTPKPFILAFYATPKVFQEELLKNNQQLSNLLLPTKETFLHLASYGNNRKLAKFLIQSGININQQDDQGQTALHTATQQGHVQFARLLLKNGANHEILNKKGELARDIANTQKNTKLIKLFSIHTK